MHTTLGEKLHPVIDETAGELEARIDSPTTYQGGDSFELIDANDVWGRTELPFATHIPAHLRTASAVDAPALSMLSGSSRAIS